MFKYTASGLFDANDFKNIGINSNYLLLFFSLANEEDNIRRQAAVDLAKLIKAGEIQKGSAGGVFCVPSWHSYSPFSPMMAAFLAVLRGADELCVSDFCSLNAIKETQEASEIFGIPATFTTFLTAHVKGTPLEDLKFNNNEKNTLRLVAADIDFEKLEAFQKDIILPLQENRTTRVAAENWVLRSFSVESPVVPDFWNEILDRTMFKSSHYNEESTYFGTVDEKHIFYALASKILEGDFIAENICDICDIIPYEKALNFEDSRMPFRKLKLAKLFEEHLRDDILYSSFEDEDLISDTMPFTLVTKMLLSHAKKIIYPASGYESVPHAKDTFAFMKAAGVTHIFFNNKTSLCPNLEKAAIKAGLEVIDKQTDCYLKEYLR